MSQIEIIKGNIHNEEDAADMLALLDLYMQDPMGGYGPMPEELAAANLEKLKQQSNYLFFIAKYNGQAAGLANCFVGFSTFKAKQLINIHDFAVSPHFRRLGIGKALMDYLIQYAAENDFCKVTLEVRHDNYGAQKLYKQSGFVECEPPMYFWEKRV